MTTEKFDKHEQVSALADGQLHGEAFALALELLSSDAEARAAWHAYHLVGDVLRSDDLAHGCAPDAFLARLQQRLRREPPVARPQVRDAVAPDAVPPQLPARAAANASAWGWKAVAACACIAAVAAVGWNAAGSSLEMQAAPAPASHMAVAAPPHAPVAVAQSGGTAAAEQVMIRDPRLDELLAAHKQFGGASALQMPAGFMRNATFEGSAR